MPKIELSQIEAKEALVACQAAICLALRNAGNPMKKDVQAHLKLFVLRLDLVKDYIGRCVKP